LIEVGILIFHIHNCRCYRSYRCGATPNL